jgi:hypothetical protein
MAQKTRNAKKAGGKEPVFIIRPALERFGLDYLHISLLALVVILIAVAFALSAFKQGVVLENCQYGVTNESCATPAHNSSEALAAAERILASYSTVNTTLALLPYYSLVNESSVSYLPSLKEWLVVIPYINPLAQDELSNMSMVLNDNLSLAEPFLQTLTPFYRTNNSVAGLGVVSLYGKALCTATKPVPVYLITDPYAPGAIPSLYTALNASRKFAGSVNMSYYFIFSGYSERFYGSNGAEDTQSLGRYLLCASRQQGRLYPFLQNLSMVYTGNPVNNFTLNEVEVGSGMNTSSFGACLVNASTVLDYQARLASLYGITSTPEFITDCRYASIPQTIGYAINYTLKSIGG